jgi:drug/metabolite transporter (DMT)-like permease
MANPAKAQDLHLHRPVAERAQTLRLIQGAVCGIAAVSIWAGWLVMMRLGVTTNLPATDLAALRFSVAGVILLPVVLRRGFAVDRLGWPGFLAVAIGGGATYVLLVGAGLLFAPVAHASALTQGALPLIVALLAAAILKEPITPPRKVGLALIVCGEVAIAGFGVTSLGTAQNLGHLCFLAAIFLWACYTVAMRRARLDGLHAAAIAAVVSLIVYLPIYVALLPHERLFAAPWRDIIWQAFYQGVLTAAVSQSLYGRAVSLLGASSGAAFIAFGPAMAALFAIPVLHEWPTPVDWFAIAIITIGVYLASAGPLPRLRRAPQPAP